MLSSLWSGPQIDATVSANRRRSGTEAIGRALRCRTGQETVRRTLWGRPRYLRGTEFLIDRPVMWRDGLHLIYVSL